MDTSQHAYQAGASSTGYARAGDGHGQSRLIESFKTVLADTLHDFSGAVGQASEKFGPSAVSDQGRRAAYWLEESAGYVREFDYQEADAKAREYIRQNPGRSLLIAGAVGLVIGAMFARR